MSGEDLLAGITRIDDESIAFAETYRRKKKSNYKAVISIAASFCLLFGVVMAFVMQSNKKPYESDEIPYELDKDGKIDILSIPGAVQIDTPEKIFFGNEAEGNGNIYEPDDFVNVVRNGNSTIVYGSIKNSKTISITDDNLIWYITTFDIDVIDNVKNAQESSTIKATSINCYDKGIERFIFLGLLNSRINIASDALRLFFLKTVPSESLFYKLFEIDGEQYSAYDFADYYAGREYDCDGESFDYYGTKIELDRLRD